LQQREQQRRSTECHAVEHELGAVEHEPRVAQRCTVQHRDVG
jgi:hypothetical protein